MSESASERSPRERQVDLLILQYEQAAEQGRPFDPDEFLKQHAEYAAELREYLADAGRLHQAVQPYRAGLDETEPVTGSPPSTLKPGIKVRYLGDYEILEELGSGGMGVVYKARQTKLKKIVALKMIKVGQFASDAEVRRFQAEARAAAKLDHPGIVAVHEVGFDHGQHYYSMDYVAGGNLSQLYREEPVPARRAAEILKKLAEAMHYAHGQGIVHRDLKPANVLLTTNGTPRITDFGLAKRLWSDDDSAGLTMTETGQVLGTAGYMSPEQAAGKTGLVNTPTDIYSLGAILYALLTSRAPFVGDSPSVTILQVINKEPVAPRALNPSVPRDLETICLKCLEKEPHKRYGTAQLLAEDLTRFLENKPVLARPISKMERVWRWCCRNPWGATALLLLLILGVGSPPIAYQQYQLKHDVEQKAKQIAGDAEIIEKNATTIKKNADEIDRQNTQIKRLNVNLTKELNEKQQALDQVTKAEAKERAARELAQSETAAKSRTLYVADMNRMDALWGEANLSTMRTLLARHVPARGQADLRDFEWYYWQRKCLQERREFVHGREARLLALSPQRDLLATAGPTTGNNHAVKVWNLLTGELEKTLLEAPGEIVAIGFAAEESEFVAVRQEKGAAAQVLNLRTGEVGRTLPLLTNTPGAPTGRYVVSPSGKLLGRSHMGFVSCRNLQDGEPLRIKLADDADIPSLRAQGHVIYSNPDGRYVHFKGEISGITRIRGATRIEGLPVGREITKFAMQVWQLTDELAPPPEEDGDPIFAFKFSPAENLLAAGTRHGELVVWELASGKELIKAQAHADLIWDVAFSADGKQLATASKDGLIKLWAIPSGRLLTTITAHADGVRTIEFSKQGMLVSGGNDHCVKIWSTVTGRAIATFQGHEQAVRDVAILAEGETILSTSRDGKVKEWSLREPDRPIVVADRTPLTCLDLFAGGEFLAATAGVSNELTIWDIGTGQIRANLSGQRESAFHVRVSPDGNSVVSGTWEGTFSTWDLGTGKVISQKTFPFRQRHAGMPAVAISPNAKCVAGACVDGKTRVYDLHSGQAIAVLAGDVNVVRIAFSPDGSELLVMLRNNDSFELRLWNADTGSAIENLADSTLPGIPRFSNDGELLAWSESVDANSAELKVWDRSAQETKQTLQLPPEFINVRALAFSPDNSQLAALVRTTKRDKSPEPVVSTLLILEISTGDLLQRIAESGSGICFLPDGKAIAVAADSGRVNVWEVSNGERRQTLARPFGPAMSVVYAPNGTKFQEPELLVSSRSPLRGGILGGQMEARTHLPLSDPNRQEQSIFLVHGQGNVKTVFQPLGNGTLNQRGSLARLLNLNATEVNKFGFSNSAIKMVDAYAPDANLVFALTPTGTLLKGDAGKQGSVDSVAGAVSRVTVAKAMATTPDGSWVAVAVGNDIQLWDGDKLELRHTLKGHEDNVGSLAFSHNGQILASAGKDRSVRLWNTNDGSLRATLLGHLKPITCLVFSKRGGTVVSSSYDCTIRLWDTVTGEAKTNLSGHVGPVHWIEFSPEGDELASAGEDGTIRLWKAPQPTDGTR